MNCGVEVALALLSSPSVRTTQRMFEVRDLYDVVDPRKIPADQVLISRIFGTIFEVHTLAVNFFGPQHESDRINWEVRHHQTPIDAVDATKVFGVLGIEPPGERDAEQLHHDLERIKARIAATEEPQEILT